MTTLLAMVGSEAGAKLYEVGVQLALLGSVALFFGALRLQLAGGTRARVLLATGLLLFAAGLAVQTFENLGVLQLTYYPGWKADMDETFLEVDPDLEFSDEDVQFDFPQSGVVGGDGLVGWAVRPPARLRAGGCGFRPRRPLGVAPGAAENEESKEAGGAMTTTTDLSFEAMLGRGEEFLILVLFAAMMYSGFAYFRRRGGPWRRAFGLSALAALLLFASILGAKMVQEALRASSPASDTPDVPVSYETWVYLGSVAHLLLGIALLICGLAFVCVGWMEGKTGRRRGARRARRAS